MHIIRPRGEGEANGAHAQPDDRWPTATEPATAGRDKEGVDHEPAQEAAHTERHEGPGGQFAGFYLGQPVRLLQVSGAPAAEERVTVRAKGGLEEVGPKAE